MHKIKGLCSEEHGPYFIDVAQKRRESKKLLDKEMWGDYNTTYKENILKFFRRFWQDTQKEKIEYKNKGELFE